MEMESADILVLQASYTNPVHAEAIGVVLNAYAQDPMGGGHALPEDILQQLPGELAKRPHIYVKFSEIFQRVDERGRRVQTGGRIPKDLAFYKPRLDEIYETFGPDRLMFASDWTNSEPMSTFGELVALDQEYFAPKGREVMEKVFWKNSLSAYRWKKRRANQPSLA